MSNGKYTMELLFDAGQVTQALNYKFYDKSGSILREEGRCAGTCHFGDGGTLDVIVIGTADAKDQMQYKITDMTLVSIPTLPLDGHDLSLFDKKRACISVKKWKAPKKKGGKRTTITTKAQKHKSTKASLYCVAGRTMENLRLSIRCDRKVGQARFAGNKSTAIPL